jgi:translation initiation factor IF-3
VEFGDTVKVEREPRYEGRRLIMTIAPVKKKP